MAKDEMRQKIIPIHDVHLGHHTQAAVGAPKWLMEDYDGVGIQPLSKPLLDSTICLSCGHPRE